MPEGSLGTTLRTIRTARGFSLAQVAAATGISRSLLSLIETGRSDITVGRLTRLAALYEIRLADLVPREIAAVVPVVAVMLALGVYPKLVLDRINPSSAGVVAWVRSVDVDQTGLPGGLRAQLGPVDANDVAIVAEGSP